MPNSNSHLLAIACFCFALPQLTWADNIDANHAKPPVRDISLRADGVLIGQVVDAQGQAVSAAQVTVFHGHDVIARTTSSKGGSFVIRRLRSGVHQVVAGNGTTIVRLWTNQAAPPVSRDVLTVVSNETAVRGQNGSDNILTGDNGIFTAGVGGLSGPTIGLLTLGATIGGIAWAVDEANEDDTPASS